MPIEILHDAERLQRLLPLAITLVVSILSLALGHYLLLARHPDLGSEARFPRQILLFILTTIAVICLVIAAPLAEGTSTSVLSIIGLGFSAVSAFSSTSFVTNFMAAITLRVTKPFNVGDFVTVGEHFDKVSERGLFDTEIQTDRRALISIPNSVLILSPITVARGTCVIVSTNLCLGDDAHHARVEPLLLAAAHAAGLDDPYVHILGLNDFSVNYRVSSLLQEIKTLLTCRSRLNACVLNTLHGHGIEIASPTTARHISVSNGNPQIPHERPIKAARQQTVAEDAAFEKANRAQARQAVQTKLPAEISALNTRLDVTRGINDDDIKHAQTLLSRLEKAFAIFANRPEEGIS
jgi:small conductance mechanosensitive channel